MPETIKCPDCLANYPKGKTHVCDPLMKMLTDKKKAKDEFNGYHFSDKKNRKKMKYIIISDGDLDINEAFACRTKRDVKKVIDAEKGYKKTLAVFEVKDVTENFL